MIKNSADCKFICKVKHYFYQQQCCLKTATIACFFSKKRAVLRSLYASQFFGDEEQVEALLGVVAYRVVVHLYRCCQLGVFFEQAAAVYAI